MKHRFFRVVDLRPADVGVRRGRALRLPALVIASALALAGGAAKTLSAAAPQQPTAVPGELIVGFKSGVSEPQQDAALAQAGAGRKRGFPQIHAALVGVAAGRSAAAAKALARDPRVRYAEPNYVVKTATVPNDPSFDQLWGLNNTGQTVNGVTGRADADIDAPEAWAFTTGSPNVVVAVIDTGVDFGHPDLAPQQWVNPGENCGSSDPTIVCAQRTNGVDDDRDGYFDDWRGWDFVNHDGDPFDDHFHGTHVSGTIGALGNNGVGVAGVSWNVRVMALKFLNSGGSGSTADAVSATLYAADHGARIASNSWGGGGFDQSLLDAINYGASKGMLFVAAAGNNGSNNDGAPFYPAAYSSSSDAVLAVAATDSNDNLAGFSNYGAASVGLGAPGVNVYSTMPGNTYGFLNGTSMATPHVSGTAALIKAEFPGATLYGIKALLLRSVDPDSALNGKVSSNGRLNAFNAVSCSNAPKVWLDSPRTGFVAPGETIPIRVIGASCAVPIGLANITVTVNGSPVMLTAASPDTGLYTGTYTTSALGPLTFTAAATLDASSDTQSSTVTVAQNYTCQDISDPFIDASGGTNLGIAADDTYAPVTLPFAFTLYGQNFNSASVSSNGFLTLGSSAGASTYINSAIPSVAAPNSLVAPFWDDLNPGVGGAVYSLVSGTSPSRAFTVEWLNVPQYLNTGAATFEATLYEGTNEVRLRYQSTATVGSGSSGTAGVENLDGSFGKQYSFSQPVLTDGKAVSCTPPNAAAPTITTTALKDATRTQSYSDVLSATGGSGSYSWSIVFGSLPAGLSLDAATGAITGTPTGAAGSYPFTARVADSASQSSTKALAIAVADPLAITTTSLAGGTVGQAYSQPVSATGGKAPYAWSLSTGNLPPGLSLSSGTPSATFSGTPTVAGTYSFTVQVADAGNPIRTTTRPLSITVAPPLTLVITSSSLPPGTAGSAYTASVTAGGGVGPYAWSLASGSLPAGLVLSSSGTPSATISGTPVKQGNYNFSIRVTDADGAQATKGLAIKINKK
jgi:subtilisin family serine protease